MYNDSFEVGDVVTPVRYIKFMDGHEHVPGVLFMIKQEEVAYYNVMGKDYKLVHDSRTERANDLGNTPAAQRDMDALCDQHDQMVKDEDEAPSKIQS